MIQMTWTHDRAGYRVAPTASLSLGEPATAGEFDGLKGTGPDSSGLVHHDNLTKSAPSAELSRRAAPKKRRIDNPLERKLAKDRTRRLVLIALLDTYDTRRKPPHHSIIYDLLAGFTDADRERIAARFWAKVQTNDAGCWHWLAAKQQGYGVFFIGRRNGVKTICSAHRLAWELTHGPIPAGLTIDHVGGCKCVNPAHMEPVTNEENIRRRDERRRARTEREAA